MTKDTRASGAARLLAGVLLLAGCDPGAVPDARPCAVLLTLDATRADALSCAGGAAGVTPSLDRLAAGGVLFENAHTSAPLTRPAHASMLTGLYPMRHGVRDDGTAALPAAARTLAELAQEAGYETAAFVALELLDARYGLSQGFATYVGPEVPDYRTMTVGTDRPGADVVDDAIDWLAARDPTRPFLLWVHLAEPYAPYEPPADLLQGAAGGHPYLGEVAALDREVGRLVDALHEAGVMDRTTLLAVGDHGEGLGEHGEPAHGVFCWESTLRVPLLLRFPDGRRAGERSRDVASVVDVMPTLAAALGLPAGAELDGVDLAAPVAPERGVYFESYQGWSSFRWSPIAGWLDARGKYVHGRVPRLFRLDQDPGEAHDLAREQPGLVGPYVDAIARACRRPAVGGGAASAERLPHPLEETGRPSPHDQLELWREWLAALDLFGANQGERALAAFEELVAKDPQSPSFREMTALARMRLGQHAEAIPLWRELVAQRPRYAGAHYNLGVSLSYGDEAAKQEAVEEIKRAVELDPFQAHFALELERLLELLGRGTEAAAVPEVVRRMRAAWGGG